MNRACLQPEGNASLARALQPTSTVQDSKLLLREITLHPSELTRPAQAEIAHFYCARPLAAAQCHAVLRMLQLLQL